MKILYDGFLKIKERIFEGKKYEVMDRGNSVTVLLVKPGLTLEGDQFYIGYQYRAGVGCRMATQVAGMIDEGENCEQAAFREAMEEAGALGRVEYMTCAFPSPGGCTEVTYQFVMFVDTLSPPTDTEEGIKWKWITGDQVLTQYEGGAEFLSMQLQNAIHLYRLNRNKYLRGF